MNIINLRTTTPIFRQEPELPPKIEFTKIEQEYIPVLKELYTLNSNIYTQKQNLHNYYSSTDRCDYRELLKRRRNLVAKLKRIAKKADKDYFTMEHEIREKREYNRFVPKILRAKTPKELQQVIELISSYNLAGRVQDILEYLIQKKKF